MNEENRGTGRVFRPKYAPPGMTYTQAREAGALRESNPPPPRTGWTPFGCSKSAWVRAATERSSVATWTADLRGSRRDADK